MSRKILHSPPEQLTALVERVTFHSEESGFCVIRGKTRGQRDLVTIVDSTASIAPGESIECSGFWQQNPKHGLQFQAVSLRVILPNTLDSLEKYLASGVIKGVGPQYAKGLQLFNDASARISAASQSNNTEDLTAGLLDMKDANYKSKPL